MFSIDSNILMIKSSATIHDLSFDFVIFNSTMTTDQILEDCKEAIQGYGLTGKYLVQITHSRTVDNVNPARSVTVQVIPNPVVKMNKNGTDRFYNQTSEITENEYRFWVKTKATS